MNRHIGRIENCSTVVSRHLNGRGIDVEMILLCDFFMVVKEGVCTFSVMLFLLEVYSIDKHWFSRI